MGLHQIKNNSLSISVNSFGAELCSVKGTDGTEYIWQAQKDIWPRYAPVLFPIVGKLNDNKYRLEEVQYNLSQHGFARDMEFICVEETTDVLEFELLPNEETFSKYPFHFSLRIRYELNNTSIRIIYIVLNPNNTVLPFSIGAHPGFISKPLNEYHLEFSNKQTLIAQKLKDGLVSDETYTIATKNGILDLSAELFANDALVFKNTQIEELTLASKSSDRKVKMQCKGWPYFGIWTKKGCNDFVCLEPWYGVADKPGFKADISEKEGIIDLEPHKSFTASYSVSFE